MSEAVVLCRRIFIQPPNPEMNPIKILGANIRSGLKLCARPSLPTLQCHIGYLDRSPMILMHMLLLVLFVSNRFSFRSSRLMAHAAELAFFQLLLPVGSQMSPAGQAPQPAPRNQQQWQPVKGARTNGQNHRHVPRRGKGRKASTTTS